MRVFVPYDRPAISINESDSIDNECPTMKPFPPVTSITLSWASILGEGNLKGGGTEVKTSSYK